MPNHSPPSSENHRSLFVKPAKRGKQRAGGEALYALHYSTFNYQPRHPHNCFISQLRRYCAIIPMNEFRNINALMVQRRMCYVGISMNVFYNINALMVQRCKRCTFDSPGLTSESEVYPGLFAVSGNNAVGVVPFIY